MHSPGPTSAEHTKPEPAAATTGNAGSDTMSCRSKSQNMTVVLDDRRTELQRAGDTDRHGPGVDELPANYSGTGGSWRATPPFRYIRTGQRYVDREQDYRGKSQVR